MMRKLAFTGFIAGLKQSIIFIFFSFLLTRPVSWCRVLGAILSSSWSLYLSLSLGFLSWQNYTNVFFEILYLVSSYNKKKPLKSLESYNSDNYYYGKLR